MSQSKTEEVIGNKNRRHRDHGVNKWFGRYTIIVYAMLYLYYYYSERFRFGFYGSGECSVTYSCISFGVVFQ